jgi:signal peptidase I
MTSPQETTLQQPLISVWLSPRQTIDRILATRPQHLVLLLASLGTISGFAAQILSFGLIDQLLNWRVLLGLAVAGTVAGIVFLYLAALVFNWTGRLFGGRASMLELRALLAWSATPSILGLIVVLVILVASKFFISESAVTPNGLSLLLKAITTICGLWSFIVLLLMLSRVQQFGFWRTIAAYVLGLILPLAVAFLIRTFLFQPFNIPSHSMVPTLLDGDDFFVSKYAYGYSHYSLPFSPPLFSGRFFGSEPARGDVVVFRSPKDSSTDFVKRVVGLPGDRIQMKQGLLYVNDAPVARERLTDFVGGDSCGSNPGAKVKRWRETLPNGVSYETLDCVDNGFYDNTNVYMVPAGHFFMMGDNRDNSTDSRVLSAIGYVPFDNIIGRIAMIYFSSARGPAGAAPIVRSERAGLIVH